ncbi:MAG: hypothetical protein CMO74_01690 [Verrucomicrobiales bacterium]|nr:hypothetical protein [Verrucomicrobiales bacterium]
MVLSPRRLRMRRRNFLKVGLGGLALPDLLALRALGAKGDRGFGKAKSCIVLFCWGGISHLDTFDLKPNAPKNIRGTFKEIPTTVPGIRIGEHLPGFARTMEHWAIVRSVHHNAPSHRSGAYWNLTGHQPKNLTGNWPATRDDWPSIGSMIWQARKDEGKPEGVLPGSVALPYTIYDGGVANGQDGGFLGMGMDPAVFRPPSEGLRIYKGKSPTSGRINLDLPEGVNRQRLNQRRGLVSGFGAVKGTALKLEARPVVRSREMALDMLLNPTVHKAFDLEEEPRGLREKYGMHICGQSVLAARRLTETGVPVATVYCAAGDLDGSKGSHFDTHADNFNKLKNNMLPPFDQAASALVEDLKERGRLEETLVVMLTDFGRTPKINGGAGRDHFPGVYSVVFAGGGIQGGQVYGKSNATGFEPAERACGPADLHATIFHALGIDPGHMIHDADNRPLPLCDGRPLALF